MQITKQIKPLSVNACWQGRRFKTSAYKAYENELLCTLPQKKLPKPPYRVYFEFGFSNKASDWDNPVKIFQDILQKKYGFNDKDIYEAFIKKVIVSKGAEYISFSMETI